MGIKIIITIDPIFYQEFNEREIISDLKYSFAESTGYEIQYIHVE